MTKTYGQWANPPEPIPLDDASERFFADVVVCGAGIAGVACALRAAENGAEVIVLEKSLRWAGRGGNIGVVNSTYMAERGYENDPETVAREWIKRCCNRCDEKILWRYLHESPRVMDWLVNIVTRPEYDCRPALQGCLYRGEPYWELLGSHRFFGGPMEKKGMRAGAADVVFAMYTEACKLGVRFFFETPAIQLRKEAGRVAGVYARETSGRTIYAEARNGVVLATGDIGGHEEMCSELSPVANLVKKIYGPKGGNLGDGHRMGLWAGGIFEDTPFPTIMHPQAYHYSNFPFLHVTPAGKRYYSEDNFVQGKSLAILREGFSYAWGICDSAWPEKVIQSLAYGGGIFWGQDCEVGELAFDVEFEKKSFAQGLSAGNVVTADTPEVLAEKMGVPAPAFTQTFYRYREMTDNGVDTDFGKKAGLLIPIDKPPYYALKFGPALLAVVGGLLVDADTKVLNNERKSIPGLYAVGNVMGGRYGVDYPILIPGNSNGTALTFGFLAGEIAARGI